VYATKTSKKRTTYRRHSKKKPAVSQAVKKYVRRSQPRIELKNVWYHDNEISLNTLAQGGCQAHPIISQGTTGLTRVGNEISLKSFHVKGVLYNNSTSETYARMIIVGHNGTMDPTFSTMPIFRAGATGQTYTVSQINGLDTMYWPLNKVEFHVYKDKVFKLAGSAAGSAAVNTKTFSQFIKFGRGKTVTYKANATGVGNQNWFITVYWIVADANDDTTTGTNVELSSLTRLWFTDA